MALKAHIAELEKKHNDLDIKIGQEMAAPTGNDIKISALKREKLRLKDEIIRLQEKLAS